MLYCFHQVIALKNTASFLLLYVRFDHNRSVNANSDFEVGVFRVLYFQMKL